MTPPRALGILRTALTVKEERMEGSPDVWSWLGQDTLKEGVSNVVLMGSGIVFGIGALWKGYLHLSKKGHDSQALRVMSPISAGGDSNAQGSIVQSPGARIENHFHGVPFEEYEKVRSALKTAEETLAELTSQMAALRTDDQNTALVKRHIREALQRGDLDRAAELLNHASDHDLHVAQASQERANKPSCPPTKKGDLAPYRSASAEASLFKEQKFQPNRLMRRAPEPATSDLEEAHRLFLSAAASKAKAGDVKYIQAAYQDSAACYQQAAALVPPEEPAILAGYLNKQGLALLAEGELVQAQAILERALDLRKKSLGPHHRDVAESLNNLAILDRIQGQQNRPLSCSIPADDRQSR